MSIISAGGAVTGADVPTPIDPRDYFNTVLYTGTGATPNAVTGVGFQPDFLWIKSRSNAYSHLLANVITGASKTLQSDSVAAEQTYGCINSFDSDGFTVDTDGTIGANNSGSTFVAWNWKANGAGVSNTAGTITSTVSANTTSGISICTYTGNGTAGATVGHGLGVAPSMVIVKERQNNNAWCVYHSSIGATKFLRLNGTDAETTQTDIWNDTAPTSTVFSVGDAPATNRNANGLVAYCFAEVSGFSKIGSYTGNGSATGPSITTDFEPTWLMIKRTDSTGDWIIHDSARDASNPRTAFLEPNTADATGTGNDVDFNSTGFQIKSTSATVNATGGTYIYMCIA